MTMKKKGKKTEEEKVAIKFIKTAMKTRKQMGGKLVGIRKA